MEPSEVIACTDCKRPNRVRSAGAGAPFCGHCGKPLPWLVSAGDTDFEAVVDAATLPVLVDFWAPWCGPCRVVAPSVAALSVSLAGRLKVVKVNTDQTPGLARRFNIKGIPMLAMISGGKEVDRITGAVPLPQLSAWVEARLASTKDAPV